MAIGEKVLFTWVHLSDLHFGHGDIPHQWDQRTVLNLLLDDLRRAVTEWPELPRIDAVMMTGDIAFSGAARFANEYERAASWLDEVIGVVNVRRENVFMVPGNHDVQRGAGGDKTTQALEAIRNNPSMLDAALDGDEGPLLQERQANYMAFSRRYNKDRNPLNWCEQLVLPHGGTLRLVGIDTACLATDKQEDTDEGKLYISSRFRNTLVGAGSRDITVLLTHHPFAGNWLFREQDHVMFTQHANLHLCGHTHTPDAVLSSPGGGNTLITVIAASAHDERHEKTSHGYNTLSGGHVAT
jgi:predicted phosphodiesterase